jgi:hypothetical protein
MLGLSGIIIFDQNVLLKGFIGRFDDRLEV